MPRFSIIASERSAFASERRVSLRRPSSSLCFATSKYSCSCSTRPPTESRTLPVTRTTTYTSCSTRCSKENFTATKTIIEWVETLLTLTTNSSIKSRPKPSPFSKRRLRELPWMRTPMQPSQISNPTVSKSNRKTTLFFLEKERICRQRHSWDPWRSRKNLNLPAVKVTLLQMKALLKNKERFKRNQTPKLKIKLKFIKL